MIFKNILINNSWRFLLLFFSMSLVSIMASLTMDQKLYTKQKNKEKIEFLKASFSETRKELIDLKKEVIINAEKFNLKKNPNVVLIKYE